MLGDADFSRGASEAVQGADSGVFNIGVGMNGLGFRV